MLRYLTPNTFLKRARLSRKLYYYTVIGLMLLIGGGVFLWQMFNPFGAKAAWYNDGWKYRMQLTFDNSGQAANLTDFPVMVHLTSSNFDFNKADFQGRDIRFTDSDGTTLIHYEVEKYDKAGRDAVLYVKVPQIDSSSSTDSIYMYYGGNDTHSYTPDPENVWPTEMRGRFHMSEKQLGENAPISNAASASATLFEYGAASSATGTSAGAITFTGSSTNVQGTSPLLHEPATFYGKINESDLSNASVRLASTSATLQVAQGFQVPKTVNVGSIRVEWGDVGTPTVVANRMYIQTDSGGLPSGSTITGGTSSCYTLSQAISSSGDTRNFEFTSRPQVIAGTQYHFVIQGFTDTNCATPKATAESGSNFHQIWNDSTGEYQYGSMSTYDGATWTSLPNADAIFDVYDDTFNITGNITVGAWVRPTSTFALEILNKGTKTYGNWYGQQGYALRTDTSLQPFFYINRGTMQTEIGVTSSTALPLNQWSYVVGRIDGSTIKVYVNGVETGSDNTTLLPAFTGDPFAIANNAGFNSRDWSGQIDEAFVYNGALSAEWIKASFLSENGTFTSYSAEEKAANVVESVAHWKLDDGTGTTAKDSARGGNDGTLTGSTLPGWRTNQCVLEKCLYFNGITSHVTVAQTVSNVKSIGFWVNPSASNSAQILALNSSADIRAASGVVSAPGVTSPTIYVNGVANGTVSANTWQYIEVTTSTGITSSAITLGKGPLGVLNGYLDDVKLYDYVRSADEIKADYNTTGNVLGAGDKAFLSEGLVGYWKLDEATADTCTGGSNDSCESSGNGLDGAWSGNATSGVGKFGNAILLDGANDYVQLSHNAALEPTEELTYAAWFKFDALTGSNVIMAKNNENAGSFRTKRIHIVDTTSVGFMVYNGSILTYNATVPTMTTDTWYHMAATVKDGQFVRIYFNGKLLSENKITEDLLLTDNQNFVIGGVRNGANVIQDLDGSVDEARVYNRALSSSEVEALYNFAPGPSGYWDFETKQGTSIADKSGNGNTATLSNGPQFKPGKYGTGVEFDGSDDVATVTNATAIDMNTSSGGNTFSAWIFADSDGEGDVGQIFNKGTNTYLRVDTQSGNNLDVEASLDLATTDATVNVSGAIQAGTWNHIAVTYDDDSDDEISLYVNGVLRGASTNGVGSLAADTSDLLIGGSTSANFDGKVDEFRFYNYARSSKQIVEDMNASHPAGGSPVGSAIGWWKFDGGSGNVASNSGSLGGTAHGSMYHFSSPSSNSSGWTSHGKVNKALRFDGADDYIEMSDLFHSESISVCAWINPRSLGAVLKTIVSKRNSAGGAAGGVGGDEWLFYVSSDKLTWSSWDSGGSTSVSVTGNTTLQTNRWYHVCSVQNGIGNPAYVYINGVQDGTSTQTGVMQNATSRIQIGGRTANNNTRYWNGDIDEVKIYNYALSPSEVKIDMNQGSALKFGVLGTDVDGKTASNSASRMYCPPGDTSVVCAPIAEWRFEERQGTITTDTAGQGLAGTLTLGPNWVRGMVGSGISFDGADDYITGSGFPTTLTTKSISAWIYPRSAGQNSLGRIFHANAASSTNGNPSLLIDDRQGSEGTRALQFEHYFDSGNGVWRANNVINYNHWQHVVVTYDNSSSSNVPKMYVNGREVTVVADSSPAGTALLADGGFTIGNREDLTRAFDGTVDELKVYNYVLSPSQVAWDYNRGKPASHWKMDECQGSSVFDSSGNGKTGTITIGGGGTQTTVGTCSTSSTAWGNGATGKFNSSLNLDGNDDYVRIDNPNLPTGDFTASVWVYNSAVGTDYVMHSPTSAGGNEFAVIITGSKQIQVFVDTSPVLTTDTVLSLNTWYHLVITRSGSTIKTYINGNQDAQTGSNANVMDFSTCPLFLGVDVDTGDCDDDLNDNFAGKIDEVQIFNYGVTAAQVRNLYNQSSAVRFGPATGAP